MRFLLYFFLAYSPFIFAEGNENWDHEHEDGLSHPRCDSCQLGTASFASTSPGLWYTIQSSAYPTTVPLSLNRNRGFSEGDISLTPNGINVGCRGRYWVNFSVVVQDVNESTPELAVFLAPNGIFNPLDISTLIGGVAEVDFGEFTTIQGSGIIDNVNPHTIWTLVAANTSGVVQPVSVVAWTISFFKI
jgi:hypothetical protein